MRNLTPLLFSAFVVIVSFSMCSSPQKLYEKGKYKDAFDKTLKSLEKGDKDRKLKTLLNKSFSRMINEVQSDFPNLAENYKIEDLAKSFKDIMDTNERYVKAKGYLDEDNLSKYTFFADRRLDLAESTYSRGLQQYESYKQTQNKLQAQSAYQHFQLAKSYTLTNPSTEFANIDIHLQETYDASLVYYNFIPRLNYEFKYSYIVDRKFSRLEGSSDFDRYIYNYTQDREHCTVYLEFGRLYDNDNKSSSTKQYSKEVQDGTKTVVDSTGTHQVPIYKTVYGSVETITNTRTVSWDVELYMRDAPNYCNLQSRRFRAEDKSEAIEYNTSGDVRAIPSQFTNASSQRLDDVSTMVEEILDEIYKDVRKYIY